MDKKEFEEKVKRLIENRKEVFTEEIKNSELYRLINTDAYLSEKLDELKNETERFNNITLIYDNLSPVDMNFRIKEIENSLERIKKLVEKIEWI